MIDLSRPGHKPSSTQVTVLTPVPAPTSVQLPPSILDKDKPIAGLNLRHRGKVRDTYDLPHFDDLMLVVTSDRVSIFDVVLPALIPDKGYILNAINTWWRQEIFPDVPSDIVAFGSDINMYLPPELKGNADLMRRATVVRRLEMIDAELIMRGNLAGSAYDAYQATAPQHRVCGVELPPNLSKWSPIDPPIFTPSTKAKVGHDEHMNAEKFREQFGDDPISLVTRIFDHGRTVARRRGIHLLDTKFELGHHKGVLTLADECLTPDSSRFVEARELEKALSDSTYNPASLDKQPVRDWGYLELELGPKTKLTQELIARIHSSTVSERVVEQTNERYHKLFKMLTGMCVREYNSTW